MITSVASNSCEGWYLVSPSGDWQVRAAFERSREGRDDCLWSGFITNRC